MTALPQKRPQHLPDAEEGTRVIICGGRDWSHRDMTYAALDILDGKHLFAQVIHGAARGADTLAGQWAKDRGIPIREFPADWQPKHLGGRTDRSAGHRRNQQMLDEGRPHLVIAFPGGAGTRSMIEKSHAAGVRVINLRDIQSWWKRRLEERRHQD